MNKVEEKIGIIYKKDSRRLNEILSDKIVDVTITSPPYFDLKDYGYKEQIGFGQKYSDYLNDLKIVFKNVFDCTRDNGTLWVIIDSFRKNNEVTPLPFDFSNSLKDVGWKLQEIIIWTKDRTVPWAHQGQMRNLFEYILLFSKKEKYNFFIDEVRDFETLKKWWVKYPERYNPKGKTPDGLWKFDIPTQGSWGKGYIKHFCPLPEEMIAQILKISTKEGYLVLDPFADYGAVLSKAANMNRNYIGFELNQSYINMFNKYLLDTGKQKNKLYLTQKNNSLSQKKFNDVIIDLRALKYAKIVINKLNLCYFENIKSILVLKRKDKVTQRNALFVIEYTFLLNDKSTLEEIVDRITELSKIPPLSKFGIQPIFNIETNLEEFKKRLSRKSLYTYSKKATHKFIRGIKPYQFDTISKSELIISPIKVDLNEKDYE